MAEGLKRVKECWQAYRAAVLRQGIPPTRADWLGRRAQRFARALPAIPLRERSEAHVRGFPRDLEAQPHVEPWPVAPAREALRGLGQQRLPRPWARPWRTHTPETPRVRPPRNALTSCAHSALACLPMLTGPPGIVDNC